MKSESIYPKLEKPLQCGHCNHVGQDVRMFLEHVGGQPGYIATPQCINKVECWKRYNTKEAIQ